jgi:hypothetical protein
VGGSAGLLAFTSRPRLSNLTARTPTPTGAAWRAAQSEPAGRGRTARFHEAARLKGNDRAIAANVGVSKTQGRIRGGPTHRGEILSNTCVMHREAGRHSQHNTQGARCMARLSRLAHMPRGQ